MATSEKVYTPAEIREQVDDLDDHFRAAARDGKLQEVFSKQRKSLVSLVKHFLILIY
jgi:hypothetical protein